MASNVLHDCININNALLEHSQETEATARIHKGYLWYLAEYLSVGRFSILFSIHSQDIFDAV